MSVIVLAVAPVLVVTSYGIWVAIDEVRKRRMRRADHTACGDSLTPEDQEYVCAVCGRETAITRGNADPPLPWPNPDGWVCWRSECRSTQ